MREKKRKKHRIQLKDYINHHHHSLDWGERLIVLYGELNDPCVLKIDIRKSVNSTKNKSLK